MSLDTTPLKFYFYYQEVLLVEYHKKSITMTTLESLQVRNLVWWELLLTLFAAGMSQHHRGERHYRVPGRGLLRCLQHPSGLSSSHRRLLRSEVGEMNDATTCLTLDFDNSINVLYFSLQMSSATLAPVYDASDHPPRLSHCHLLLSSRHLSSSAGIFLVK